jgi:hypothetical protein
MIETISRQTIVHVVNLMSIYNVVIPIKLSTKKQEHGTKKAQLENKQVYT